MLLLGDGGTFCSGSDLVGVRASVIKEGRNSTELTARIATSVGLQLAQVMQYNLIRLQRLPMVSVALIEGYALGGGAELATGADLRLMSGELAHRQSTLRMPYEATDFAIVKHTHKANQTKLT